MNIDPETGVPVRPLTEDKRSALNEFLPLLGLQHADGLHVIDMIALCDRFYSLPHESRTEEDVIAAQIKIALLVLQATNRKEATKTIANSRMLQDKLDEVYVVTEQLLSGEA